MLPVRRNYHHGNLRQTLIDTAVALIEEMGPEHVSVRDIAKRAGVSPGAPFRHFPSRDALFTAVAEDAMDRLVAAISAALVEAKNENPLMQFRAIGIGFMQWAIANPAHFHVISTRSVIDYDGSSLRARNDLVRVRMRLLIERAQAEGLVRDGDPDCLVTTGRALAYGIARMYIDGQFPSWGLDQQKPFAASMVLLDQYIASIRTAN